MLTMNNARGKVKDAIHQATLGKETHKVEQAIDLLAQEAQRLRTFLEARKERTLAAADGGG